MCIGKNGIYRGMIGFWRIPSRLIDGRGVHNREERCVDWGKRTS